MLTAENMLPIGSIVRLEENKKYCFAVVGYGLKIQEHCFDYVGVFYPLGEKDDETVRPFDTENISEVLFKGYTGPEGRTFSVTSQFVLAAQQKMLTEKPTESKPEESNELD